MYKKRIFCSVIVIAVLCASGAFGAVRTDANTVSREAVKTNRSQSVSRSTVLRTALDPSVTARDGKTVVERAVAQSRTDATSTTPSRSAVRGETSTRENTTRTTSVARTATSTTPSRSAVRGETSTRGNTAKTRTPLATARATSMVSSSRVPSLQQTYAPASRTAIVVNNSSSTTTENVAESMEMLEYCKTQYGKCMDNYCNVLDADMGRCSCSANIKNYEKTSKALEEANEALRDVAQQIQYIGLSADDIETIFSETEAEVQLSKSSDNSQIKNSLNKIKEMIVDVKKGSAATTTTTSGIAIDVTGLLSFNFDEAGFDIGSLFGNTSGTSSILNQRGATLYKSAATQCKTAVLDFCKSNGIAEAQVTNAYDMEIDKDCLAYEVSLREQNDNMSMTVRNAENVLRKARLMVKQNENAYDLAGCVNALDTCMRSDFVCGDDYENCLDPSGKYIIEGEIVAGSKPNPALYDAWKYDGGITPWDEDGLISDYINAKLWQKKPDSAASTDMAEFLQYKIGYYDDDKKINNGLCMGVLNQCKNYTYEKNKNGKAYRFDNPVVREYLSRILPTLKKAQDDVLADYAETCASDVISCLNTNGYASMNEQIAKNACSSISITCENVTNGLESTGDADLNKWIACLMKPDENDCASGTGSGDDDPTVTACSAGKYLSDGKCKSCPSGYPNSAAGITSINKCYKTESATCTQNDGAVPAGCASVTEWEACSCDGATTYKKYYNNTTEGTTSVSCTKKPKTVTPMEGYTVATDGKSCVEDSGTGGGDDDPTVTTCTAGEYLSGDKCTQCPSGYPNSVAGATAQSQCSKTCAAYTESKITYTPKAEYATYGNECEYDQCSTSKECSSLGSEWSGTYSECDKNQNTKCSKTCTLSCSGEAACPDHATCTYDETVTTSGTQYYGDTECPVSAAPCPMKNFTCDQGFTRNGDACVEELKSVTITLQVASPGNEFGTINGTEITSNKYSVTFTCTPGDSMSLPEWAADPSENTTSVYYSGGKEFIGWGTQTYGNPVDAPNTCPDEDTTYYTQWKECSPKCTTGVGVEKCFNHTKGDKCSYSGICTSGFVNKDNNGRDATCDEDGVCSCVGAPSYTVNYNCGAGTKQSSLEETVTITYNNDFTPAAADGCTNPGHTFAGWSVSGTTDVKNAGATFKWTYTENKTFTAKWNCAPCSNPSVINCSATDTNNVCSYSATCARGYTTTGEEDGGTTATCTESTCTCKPRTFNVTYDCNGGTLAEGASRPQSVTFGTQITVPKDICTRDGYHIKEWAGTDCGGGQASLLPGDKKSWTFGCDMIFYAKWQSSKAATIAYSCGEGVQGNPPNSLKVNVPGVYYPAYELGYSSCEKPGYAPQLWSDRFIDVTSNDIEKENQILITMTWKKAPTVKFCKDGQHMYSVACSPVYSTLELHTNPEYYKTLADIDWFYGGGARVEKNVDCEDNGPDISLFASATDQRCDDSDGFQQCELGTYNESTYCVSTSGIVCDPDITNSKAERCARCPNSANVKTWNSQAHNIKKACAIEECEDYYKLVNNRCTPIKKEDCTGENQYAQSKYINGTTYYSCLTCPAESTPSDDKETCQCSDGETFDPTWNTCSK